MSNNSSVTILASDLLTLKCTFQQAIKIIDTKLKTIYNEEQNDDVYILTNAHLRTKLQEEKGGAVSTAASPRKGKSSPNLGEINKMVAKRDKIFE